MKHIKDLPSVKELSLVKLKTLGHRFDNEWADYLVGDDEFWHTSILCSQRDCKMQFDINSTFFRNTVSTDVRYVLWHGCFSLLEISIPVGHDDLSIITLDSKYCKVWEAPERLYCAKVRIMY